LLVTKSSKSTTTTISTSHFSDLWVGSRLPINEDDVALIFEDLHRGRSVVPPHDVPTRPTLVRWDPTRPLSLENCVVFELNEADKHVRECWESDGRPKENVRPQKVWGDEVGTIVERRMEEARRLRAWIM